MRRLALVAAVVASAGLSLVSAQAPAVYDLLIKNGRVYDPASGKTTRADVAVERGRIARIAADIPAHQAKTVVDAGTYYVTPGLIDLHAYVNGQRVFRQGEAASNWRGVNPEHNAARHGVTTVVDAGSAGWRTFDRLKTLVIDRTRGVRVLAFLNIVADGIDAPSPADADAQVQPAVDMARRHPEIIVGIRSPHAAGLGRTGVERAVAAAGSIQRAALVEYLGEPTLAYGDLLQRVRPGDLVTHAFGLTTPLLEGNGEISPAIAAARTRGVLFDLGHGTRGFFFRVAAPAARKGFLPDVISTGMDKESLLLPRADMTTTLSKLLSLGVPLEQVLERVTIRPARAINRPELGTLREGGIADIAVLDVQKGRFGFVDAGRSRMQGTTRVEAVMTVRNGRVIWDTRGLSRAEWSTVGPYSNYR